VNARDVMTREVVSVAPDTPVRKIAALLAKKGISAVPVVDCRDAPIGIVSEGDLIGRREAEREARQDWWLTTLAEGEAVNPEFLASLRLNYPTARDVMSAPVITVGEETSLAEIARLLTTHCIKRVPVVRWQHRRNREPRRSRACSGRRVAYAGCQWGDLMTTIGMSDGRPREPSRLRQIATWYREFAERTSNPSIWEARLRTAAELEREADRLEGASEPPRETETISE
jgi:CBS domain-containing protein